MYKLETAACRMPLSHMNNTSKMSSLALYRNSVRLTEVLVQLPRASFGLH